MTETEWFACTDPKALAAVVRGKVHPIRFREMALQWINVSWRRRWPDRTHLFQQFVGWLRGEAGHPRMAPAINPPVLEADASYSVAVYDSNAAVDRLVWDDDALSAVVFAGTATIELQSLIQGPFSVENIVAAERRKAEIGSQFATQFRDITGNPFRPVAWQPEWNTETAVALARGIEIDGAFDRMGILADALEDAGCESQQVLQHCRNESPHVVGCWVLDSVFGRAV